jgi:adenine-specific DNA-methyltransferase
MPLLRYKKRNLLYVKQNSLFNIRGNKKASCPPTIKKSDEIYFCSNGKNKTAGFQLQNRRYLGNKYKLLAFIEEIINRKCNDFNVFCDIFAGAGVVGERFNKKNIKVIANDFLESNYIPLKAFLGTSKINFEKIEKKIAALNNLQANKENYFSKHFGQTYFTLENAKKIGAIREKIDEISNDDSEEAVLVSSLIYAVDKVANTVGHYDAYRKKMDTTKPLRLLLPDFKLANNANNKIYKEDANRLIRKISCDVLYIDPPYNSRQYSDIYHLLENLAVWNKPQVALAKDIFNA